MGLKNGDLKFGPAGGVQFDNPGLRMLIRQFPVACYVFAIVMAVFAFGSTFSWPVIGDTSLIRYAIFLHESGMAPYRDIPDINLPGSYFIDGLAMKLFGMSALGLRLYDLLLCLTIIGAMAMLAGSGLRKRLAGMTAGCLFTLIHLQDGVFQAGQRDLAMTAIALFAIAFCLPTVERLSLWRFAAFEFLIGSTFIIKPTLALFSLLPFAVIGINRFSLRRILQYLSAGIVGFALPTLLALAWLARYRALGDFALCLRSIIVMHASMGRKTTGFLIIHSGAPVAWLLSVMLLIWALRPSSGAKQSRLLLAALTFALVSYIVQAKAYPYQRYPFLAFFLLIALIQFEEASKGAGVRRFLACGGLAALCIWMAPRALQSVRSFDHGTLFQDALTHDLKELGARDGEVQCIDTFAGCDNALLQLRLVQATGFLYDCYLYAPESAEDFEYRRRFLAEFDSRRPRIVVVTDQYCFASGSHLDRIDAWPPLADRLRNEYVLQDKWSTSRTQRWWSRNDIPPKFLIYERR